MAKKHLSSNNKHINLYHNTFSQFHRTDLNKQNRQNKHIGIKKYWRCKFTGNFEMEDRLRRPGDRRSSRPGDRRSAVLKQIKNMLDTESRSRWHRGMFKFDTEGRNLRINLDLVTYALKEWDRFLLMRRVCLSS